MNTTRPGLAAVPASSWVWAVRFIGGHSGTDRGPSAPRTTGGGRASPRPSRRPSAGTGRRSPRGRPRDRQHRRDGAGMPGRCLLAMPTAITFVVRVVAALCDALVGNSRDGTVTPRAAGLRVEVARLAL